MNSFKYAFHGFKVLIKEPNFKIHIFISLLVIFTGMYFQLNQFEWIIIFFAIGFVILSEILNSSIEYLADSISIEYNENIKIAKDLGASAVLFSSCISSLIGIFIFYPKLNL